MAEITAFVLAGGRSSRMGTDKAMLTYGDESLLERTMHTVASLPAKTCIVGPKQRYENLGEIVEDIYPGCGPLGGIHAALSATATDLNLIVSVDMPRMTVEFLRWLVERAATTEELIAVPDIAGGLQPLCAAYRRAVGGYAEQALRDGDYKIGHLFSRVPTRILHEREIIAAGFSPEIFQNVNTLEEYAQCRPTR